MVVNIIMLAHNRPNLTRQAVDSLYANTPHDSFNLTIIDDNSDKAIRDLNFHTNFSAKNLAILRIEHSHGITGQARNLGVYWAEKYWGRGDWLYLSDNDVYFTPEWLPILVTCAMVAEHDNAIKVMGGWNHPYLQPKHAVNASGFTGTEYNEHDAVTGASQLMKWDIWDEYGPQDAHAPGVCQSEDWKFCQDIIQDGGRVGSIYPRVVLNCGITNSMGEKAPGWDVMLKDLLEAKKEYPNLIWE